MEALLCLEKIIKFCQEKSKDNVKSVKGEQIAFFQSNMNRLADEVLSKRSVSFFFFEGFRIELIFGFETKGIEMQPPKNMHGGSFANFWIMPSKI